MARNLVAPAKKPVLEVLEDGNGAPKPIMDRETARQKAAELLGVGFSARQVGMALAKWISPTGSPRSSVETVRRWMKRDPAFRDMIYQASVVRLDLRSPHILDGVAKAAMRGRVDAARLALEITGRHQHDDAPVTQVAIVLNNIPRPNRDSAQLEGPQE
jgi:hypothetical protein